MRVPGLQRHFSGGKQENILSRMSKPGKHATVRKTGRTRNFTPKTKLRLAFRGFAKKNKFQKSEITMELGGWVQVSLGIFVVENHPKIPLNQ